MREQAHPSAALSVSLMRCPDSSSNCGPGSRRSSSRYPHLAQLHMPMRRIPCYRTLPLSARKYGRGEWSRNRRHTHRNKKRRAFLRRACRQSRNFWDLASQCIRTQKSYKAGLLLFFRKLQNWICRELFLFPSPLHNPADTSCR